MKPRERECIKCGTVIVSCSKSLVCIKCVAKAKELEKIAEEKKALIGYGYTVLGEPTYNDHHKRVYKLITPCCGTEYSPTFGNIRKQVNLLGKPPCKTCGGKERAAKGLAGYVKKYGADYDESLFEEYASLTRRISETNYRTFKDQINPLDLPRGHGQWHLDHKVPIMWCFKNGIDPILAGGLGNLQMLKAEENIKKSDRHFDRAEAIAILEQRSPKSHLLELLGIQTSSLFEVIHDYANVSVADKILVREAEINSRLQAVKARLAYAHKLIANSVGARELDLVELQNNEDRDFLEMWHIQGSSPRTKAYGLKKGDQLLAVMTFGPPRFKQKEADWELIRFCSHGEVSVVGAASRLLKRFVDDVQPKKIVSYSLNRWGSGSMYEILGFEKIASNQALFYLWPDKKIRSRRATILKCRKDNVDIKDLKQIRDPGSTTWHLSSQNISKGRSL